MNTDILFKPAVCAAFSLLAIASINEKQGEQGELESPETVEEQPTSPPAELRLPGRQPAKQHPSATRCALETPSGSSWRRRSSGQCFLMELSKEA